jgi:hypothetical protein
LPNLQVSVAVYCNANHANPSHLTPNT